MADIYSPEGRIDDVTRLEMQGFTNVNPAVRLAQKSSESVSKVVRSKEGVPGHRDGSHGYDLDRSDK